MSEVIFPTEIPNGTPASDDRILLSDTSDSGAAFDAPVSLLPVSDPTQAALDQKVDKVSGKGLSSEDYTTTEKNKLAWIEAGAEVNEVNEAPIDGTEYARKNGAWVEASGGGGGWQVDSVVAGTSISVDDTDPENPIVSLSLGSDENFVTDAEKTVLSNTSGTNTGDETESTIKSKLGITTLSGSNTGDQDLSSLATKSELGGYALNCDNQFAITDYTFDGTERRNSGYLVTTASNRTVNIDADLFPTWYEVTLCKGTDNANTVTLDAGSGNNINGTQTYVLDKYNEAVTLLKDGTSTWKIKSHYYPSSVLAKLAGATFTGDVSVPDEAYDATTWNGNNEVPTKNAIRDKIESMGSGGPQQIRIRIPWELVADTSNYQGVFWKNDTGATITISNVGFYVGLAAQGTGAAAAFNVYKSSGTDTDGINTSAVNLFTSAVNLGTSYSSATNAPNTATVESGRWVSLRCTSSAGATRKASDCEVIITYS